MIRSRLDLPEPLGPSSAVSEPPGTSSETSSSADEVAEALGDLADGDHERLSFAFTTVINSNVANAISASSADAA